jgi:hypothetical protein
VHRQWYLTTAMDALLGTFAVAEKDRLYRCLDRVLEHKQELFLWLRQKVRAQRSTDAVVFASPAV